MKKTGIANDKKKDSKEDAKKKFIYLKSLREDKLRKEFESKKSILARSNTSCKNNNFYSRKKSAQYDQSYIKKISLKTAHKTDLKIQSTKIIQAKGHTKVFTSQGLDHEKNPNKKKFILQRNHPRTNSIKSNSEGNITTSSAEIIGKILSKKGKLMSGGRLTITILLLQLLSTAIGISGVIGLRTNFTGHGEHLLKMRNLMEEVFTADRQIRQIFSAIGKCGIIQENFPDFNTEGLVNIAQTVKLMAKNSNTDSSKAEEWITQLGMENDYKWFKMQIERNLYKLEDTLINIKEILFEELTEENIRIFFDTKVNGYYFETFTSNIITEQKRQMFNFFDLYYYLVLNIRYMLENEVYSLKKAPYLALDLNIGALEVVPALLSSIQQYFVYDTVDQFSQNREFANRIIFYCNFAIVLIMISLVPLLVRVLKAIKRTYSVLQDLYNFELRFQMTKLDELEDSLDVCLVNSAVIEGLIKFRKM